MPQLYSKSLMTNGSRLMEERTNHMGIINRNDIKKIIPYGDDFLFLDFVDSLTNNSIRGFYEVPRQSPLINAHFVHDPIMPGCLIAESFAQAGTILIRDQLKENFPVDIYVGNIEVAKYSIVVKPGQLLRHEVQLKNLNSNLGIARLQGGTYVENKVVASFSLVLAITKTHTV